ncbi:hypothetical protein I33_3780 [Bacillus subtilis subsp. subtilis str. RO-NN-1]|nr:hypothetical protein I33_3780 [Bacillus subtilis subsp. subtilis str. RO-NN-1]
MSDCREIPAVFFAYKKRRSLRGRRQPEGAMVLSFFMS